MASKENEESVNLATWTPRSAPSLVKPIDAALGIILLVAFFAFGVIMMSRPRKSQAHSRGERRRLLCLVPTTLEDLEAKGVVGGITYRDLGGYFDHVHTIHFPARKDSVIQLSNRHTILEFSRSHYSNLHAFPFVNLVASEARCLMSLLHLIRAADISVIKAQDPYLQGANAFFLSKVTGIPFLISVHSNYDLTRRITSRLVYRIFRFYRIEKAIEKFVFQHAGLVIAISDDNLAFAMRNGAPPIRALTVRVPPLSIHYEEGETPRNLKSKLGLKGWKIILYVGRLSPEKYPDDVIRCASYVANKRDDVIFVFVGDGPMRDELERLAFSLGTGQHVRMLGFQSQRRVRDLMRVAEVIVSPLTGRALVEATLSGTPVVAYDIEWHRELIRDHDTGLLVPYRDHEAMAEAVLWILDHPSEAHALGKHGREAGLQNFRPRRLMENERACFERLLSRGISC